MNKTIYILTALIVGLVIGYVAHSPSPAGFAFYNSFGSATNATISVDTSSATEVLSANSGRLYALISNQDSTNPVYCVFGATSTAGANKGIKIEAGEYYEITPQNLYTGKVSCIATGGAVVVGIIEK
ncbi:MAG: hypothetical protein DRH24_14225 [Deltaproteobacteria bacterium]|nr:MAG: hypothetical protein DRH24_14225 [Deltaproteobacteria bacterium]